MTPLFLFPSLFVMYMKKSSRDTLKAFLSPWWMLELPDVCLVHPHPFFPTLPLARYRQFLKTHSRPTNYLFFLLIPHLRAEVRFPYIFPLLRHLFCPSMGMYPPLDWSSTGRSPPSLIEGVRSGYRVHLSPPIPCGGFFSVLRVSVCRQLSPTLSEGSDETSSYTSGLGCGHSDFILPNWLFSVRLGAGDRVFLKIG